MKREEIILEAKRKARLPSNNNEIDRAANSAFDLAIKQYSGSGLFSCFHEVVECDLDQDVYLGKPLAKPEYDLHVCLGSLPNASSTGDEVIIATKNKLYAKSGSTWAEVSDKSQYLDIIPDVWIPDFESITNICIGDHEIPGVTIRDLITSRGECYNRTNVANGLVRIRTPKSYHVNLVYNRSIVADEWNIIDIDDVMSVLLVTKVATMICRNPQLKEVLDTELESIGNVKAGKPAESCVFYWSED